MPDRRINVYLNIKGKVLKNSVIFFFFVIVVFIPASFLKSKFELFKSSVLNVWVMDHDPSIN